MLVTHKYALVSTSLLSGIAYYSIYLFLVVKRIIEPFLHFLFWILISYITYSNFGVRVKVIKMGEYFSSSKEFSSAFLIVTLIFIAFKMLLFYGSTHHFLPKYFNAQQKNSLKFKLSCFFLLSLGLSTIINYFVIKDLRVFESGKGYSFFAYSAVMHFLIFFIAIAYRLGKNRFKDQLVISQLKQEKLKAELDLLKEQVNPHFLFNTLNNLYSEARKQTDKTVANGIAKLSHIMRYMIYDSNVEFIDLEKEIQYLESYIELQKLRIDENDPFEFVFNKDEVDTSVKVAPILFIPFVENAFKYGVYLNEKSFIHMSLQNTKEALCFKISNSKFDVLAIKEHSGVGLPNVKRRLELLYPNQHELNIHETEKEFHVELLLKLSE